MRYSFHQPVMSIQVLGMTQGQGLRRSIGCTRFGGSQSTQSCSVPQIHAPVFCSSPLLPVCFYGRSQLVCPSRLGRGLHNARLRNHRLLPSKIQPPRFQDRNDATICMAGHDFCVPSIGWIGRKELNYGPHPTSSFRGSDVKHRTHRLPLGRLTTYLSNEGLAIAVLDGVLIVDPVKGPIGETDD